MIDNLSITVHAFTKIMLTSLCLPLSSFLQDKTGFFYFLYETILFYQIYHIYEPLHSGRIWHKVNFFKQSLTGLNSEFSFS